MMEDEEGPAQAGHYVLLGIAMLIIMAAILVSARPITLGNVPDVAHVADIPARATLYRTGGDLGYGGYFVPKTRLRPQLAFALQGGVRRAPVPKLGYSVRQVSFLGLPMIAYRELGYVVYYESPFEIRMLPLSDEGLAQLGEQAGEDLTAGWIFPFWIFCWGWIVPLIVAVFGYLEWRRQVRRRAELGLI